jgi:hypothetical protein
MIPCIKMLARMKTYTDNDVSDELDPFYLAAANFSQLKRTDTGKVVAICYECLLCITNVDKKTDALRVHCVFNRKCMFILQELSLEEIVFIRETSDMKKLLNDHFYMYSTIKSQNSNITLFWYLKQDTRKKQ